MEGFDKNGKKEPRFDFAKTLEGIAKLAEEKLGAKGRRHFGAGEKVARPEDAKPFFIERGDGDAQETGLGNKFKKSGPDEHEETDPYDRE